MMGASMLRQVNVQVLEDIQDFIMLKALPKNTHQVKKKIQDFLDKNREIERTLMTEEIKEENDPVILGKKEDRLRDFLVNDIKRPNKQVWNFLQDEKSDNFVPHVLRPDADPREAYQDGRINDLFEIFEDMAVHLRSFNEARWKQINKAISEIFVAKNKTRMAEYEKAKEKQAEGQ